MEDIALTPEQEVSWAADCAERVLPIYEARFPDDSRPRRAVEAVRLFLADRRSPDELLDAAWPARHAAKEAAKEAAYPAEEAASQAASAAASTAYGSTRTAFAAYAYGATRAAYTAEIAWQQERRAFYAGGGEIADPLAGLSEPQIETALSLWESAGLLLEDAIMAARQLVPTTVEVAELDTWRAAQSQAVLREIGDRSPERDLQRPGELLAVA